MAPEFQAGWSYFVKWRCLTRERKKKGLERWKPLVVFGLNFLREDALRCVGLV